jgi:uncharacterized protein (TIGR02147 family)
MAAPTPASPARPVVFRYLDARKFLADAFDFEKVRNPALSHRYVAKAMGASSSGFFKEILTGRIRLSPGRVVKFSRLFKLSPREADHFELLVLYTQASSAEEKDRYLAKMTEAAVDGKQAVLEAFQLEYFNKWHYAAVRELLAIRDFRGGEEECERLAALLDPPITARDMVDTIQLLVKLKLIRKNAQGRYERVEKVIRSGRKADPAQIKPALRGNLELAMRALDAHPAEVRPFSYLTVSISEASLEPIREKIATLRREILELATRDEAVDRLYQLNFQMFPLTKSVKPAIGEKKRGKS